MAILPNIFKPEEAQENPFAPIPADWYLAEIIKSEVKATRSNDGKYLALTFKILEGDHSGRMIFANLNLVNKSEVAVKIAESDLKAICEAVNFEGDLEDTFDLHNIAMQVKVSLKPETAQWPAKNELKNFKPEDWEAISDENSPDDDDMPF